MDDSGGTAADRDRAGEVIADPKANSAGSAALADDLPVSGERLDGFISYSRRSPDREFVDWLSRELANQDKQIWVDRSNIEPAADWRARITRGIELANAFIFVISPASAASAECMAELSAAVANHKRIIPVVLSRVSPDDLPVSLTAPNWIDFESSADRAAQVDQVIEALDADLEWRDASTRLAARAREWENSGKDRSFLLRGADLKAAETWYEDKDSHQEQPTSRQDAYLAASRRGASRRLRLGLTVALCALAVAVALSIAAVVQRDAAITQTHIAQSEQLAAKTTGLWGTNAPLAMLLSVAAYDSAATTEARTALIRAGTQPLRRYLTVGPSGVTAIAYSPNGKDLATGDANGRIAVWETATWSHTSLRLSSGNSGITALAFSRDQPYLVAADSAGHSGVWDMQTGKIQTSGRRSSNSIQSLAFSRDGRFLAAGYADGKVLLSNLATGHSAILSEGYQVAQPVSGLAFSPDGQILAVGNTLGGVQLWDTATGHRSKILIRRTESTAVTSLAFSPDGRTVAVAGFSDLVRLWSISATGTPANLAAGGPVESVAYSPTGKTLAAGTSDGIVGLWNVTSHTQTASFGEGSAVTAIAYSPDGKTLAVADSSGHVGLWDTAAGSKASTLREGDGSPVTSVAFSPDGKTLTAGDLAGNVELWNTSSRHVLAGLSEVLETYSTAFSPNGRTLAVGWRLGVDLWNVANRQHPVLESPRRPSLSKGRVGGADSIAFNRNGTLLADGDYFGGVSLWSVAGHHRLAAMNEGSSVNSVSFSPDGKILAVGDANGHITLWGVASHTRLAAMTDGGSVSSVAFSPDGQTLAVGNQDGYISVWQVARHQRTVTLPDGSAVGAVSFSPDGQTLVSGDALGDVNTWNLASHQRLATLAEAGTSISSLAFSRDGQEIAAGGNNGTVTLLTQRTVNPSQSSLTRLICDEVRGNITGAQWADSAPGVPYQKTCPAYP